MPRFGSIASARAHRLVFGAIAILAVAPTFAATYKCKDAAGNWSEAACTPKKRDYPPEIPKAIEEALQRHRDGMSDPDHMRTRYHGFCLALSKVDAAVDTCVDKQMNDLAQMLDSTAGLASSSDRDLAAKACFSEWYDLPIDLVNAMAWRACFEEQFYPR